MKSAYCGGGFSDNQLLWIIPVLDGYCKKNNVKILFFERQLSNRIKNNKFITQIVKDYDIFYLKSNFSFMKILNLFLFFFKEYFRNNLLPINY